MLNEYIRRDAALRAVTKRYGACRSPAQNRLLDEIRNEIRRMPAADVAEEVNAQWDNGNLKYTIGESVKEVRYCSKCGCGIEAVLRDVLYLPKYCPECGAKMDGGTGNSQKTET